MASTTTAFETEVLAAGISSAQRSLCAGPSYKLRSAYGRGITDPEAHRQALQLTRQVDALNRAGLKTSFDAIASA